MTFDIHHDGRVYLVSTQVGDGLTKFIFTEITEEQEVLTTEESTS